MQTGYIKSLDGIRAFAIVLVMTFHFGLLQFGWFGVQLFFVLSGFLISGILWKERKKTLPLKEKFKKFWVRRSLRIFPLYYAYLAVAGLGFLFFAFPSYFTTYGGYAATYTINFSRTIDHWQTNPVFTHLWSLSVEEQFYLIFPLLMLLSPVRFLRWVLASVIVLTPVVRYLLAIHYHSKGFAPEVVADIVYWNTFSHLDAFFIGALIPVLDLGRRIKKPGTVFIACATLAIGAGALNYFMSDSIFPFFQDWGYSHGRTHNLEHVWQYTVLNACFASLILLIVSPYTGKATASLKRFLENKWLVSIGRVSYGMYLFHWVFIIYVFRPLLSDNYLRNCLVFIPYLLVVYLFSELSYRFFEIHFIRMKDRFFPDKKRVVVAEKSGA